MVPLPPRRTPAGASGISGPGTTYDPDEYDFGPGISNPNFDVTPDGRFVMLRRGPNGGTLHVVVHWTEELTRILATGGVR